LIIQVRLVKLGAKLDLSISRNTILINTIYAGHTLAAFKLLDLEPALAKAVTSIGVTPFMAAARSNDLPLMERLFAMGIDVRQKDNYNYDALDYAIAGCAQEAIDFLKAKGLTADPMVKLKIYDGSETHLIFIARKLNAPFLKNFLNDPLVEIDGKDSRNHPALFYALTASDSKQGLAIAKLLLERSGANVNLVENLDIKDTARRKIFENAKICKKHFEKGVKLLFKTSKDLRFFDALSFNSEFLSAQKQYPEYFEALLNKFLDHPQIFLKEIGIRDKKLPESAFQRLLQWCNDNIESFRHNANLLLLLGQLSYEGRYVVRERAAPLLEKARAQELDLPTWKRELCVKLLDCVRAKDGKPEMHLSQLEDKNVGAK
jgi:ankyrin repeat protein